jgi:hypothetical protein
LASLVTHGILFCTKLLFSISLHTYSSSPIWHHSYPPNFTNYRGASGMLGTPSSVGPCPTPHSGSQTPLLPPQPAISGFFRGV